jgi:hypothetical protein
MSDFSRAMASAARLCPVPRNVTICDDRTATTAYSAATKKALSPISSGIVSSSGRVVTRDVIDSNVIAVNAPSRVELPCAGGVFAFAAR